LLMALIFLGMAQDCKMLFPILKPSIKSLISL